LDALGLDLDLEEAFDLEADLASSSLVFLDLLGALLCPSVSAVMCFLEAFSVRAEVRKRVTGMLGLGLAFDSFALGSTNGGWRFSLIRHLFS
jgi:hypothetical protein